AEAVATTIEAGGPPHVSEPFVSLWERVVDGSGNLAYRLALNSLNSALTAYPLLGERLAPRDPIGLRELGAAISAGDGTAADAAARRLLEPDIELAD
ncbi:MAG: FadR family transcriptional regulator, partial [Solirubrobacterales bacterium]|nr:FadR family transcriptional regulator [Solirubrobacterales bacterium]